MKLIVPKYYKDFKCKGGSCTDNCCIGWEIDIDSETLSKYDNEKGSLGERLKKNISREDTPHFILRGERCPFLNADNLCDIIIERGEGNLCDICREHPRFYTTLNDMIFGGVGLCCEEAARLVLTADTPEYITLEAEGDYEECDGELLEIFLDLREEISKIFARKEQTLVYIVERAEQAVKKAQSRADAESENPYEIREVSHKTIVEIVENSELLSDELPTLLKKSLCPNLETIKNNIVNNYLQNIFLYFLDRYLPKAVEDGDFLSKFEVAIFSLKAIELLFLGEENLTLDRAVYLTKLYSKEMEYNEDNIAAIEQI